MDGVMFMHSQRLPLLRQVLDDGQSVGAFRRITSQFSFVGKEEFFAQNIRVKSRSTRKNARARILLTANRRIPFENLKI